MSTKFKFMQLGVVFHFKTIWAIFLYFFLWFRCWKCNL